MNEKLTGIVFTGLFFDPDCAYFKIQLKVIYHFYQSVLTMKIFRRKP